MSQTISIKIDLRQLKSATMKLTGKETGKQECLVIPIDQNNLFRGSKGAIYLDLTAFELKEQKPDSKDTHLVKQSLPKEVFEKLSDNEKKALPIFGNAIDWARVGSQPQNADIAEPTDEEETDDLPF